MKEANTHTGWFYLLSVDAKIESDEILASRLEVVFLANTDASISVLNHSTFTIVSKLFKITRVNGDTSKQLVFANIYRDPVKHFINFATLWLLTIRSSMLFFLLWTTKSLSFRERCLLKRKTRTFVCNTLQCISNNTKKLVSNVDRFLFWLFKITQKDLSNTSFSLQLPRVCHIRITLFLKKTTFRVETFFTDLPQIHLQEKFHITQPLQELYKLNQK